MTNNKPKPTKFRRVRPLVFTDDPRDPETVCQISNPSYAFIGASYASFTVPQARAIRDWLNKALPDDT